MLLGHTGSALAVEALSWFGVKQVWGYPGGSVLPVYDKLYKHKDLHHLLTQTEQAAVFAATSAARGSRAPGVCLVTSGPGITNAITGVTSAFSDSLPILVLSGQVPVKGLGKQSFQECDAISLTKPCTKRNFLVAHQVRSKQAFVEAFYLLNTNKPAPVHLDFPKNISKAVFLTKSHSSANQVTQPAVTVRSAERHELAKAKRLMLWFITSARPVLYVGGGSLVLQSAGCTKQLLAIAQIPCVSSLMSVSTKTKPASLGMVGMHGNWVANLALYYCDLLIAVGSRFDDRVVGNIKSFVRTPKTVALLNVSCSLREGIPVDLAVRGNLVNHLYRLMRLLSLSGVSLPPRFRGWSNLIRCLRLGYAVQVPANVKAVLRAVKASTTSNTTISTDVGQHQMFVARHYDFGCNDTWFSSGGLGAMGSGLPLALGLAATGTFNNVVSFNGDGSILMSLNELLTVKQLGLAVQVVVLNNRSLGMVRQWQQVEHKGRYSNSEQTSDADFVRLAVAFGHIGKIVPQGDKCSPVVNEAVNQRSLATLLVVPVSKDANVWPMVQAGKGVTNMLLNHNDIS